jgi:hypothetical protein
VRSFSPLMISATWQIEYKTAWPGGTVIVADRWFAA